MENGKNDYTLLRICWSILWNTMLPAVCMEKFD